MMNQFYCRKEQFLLEAVPAAEAAPLCNALGGCAVGPRLAVSAK